MATTENEQFNEKRGFSVGIFKNKNKALHYQCSICKQICNNPVELACDDDNLDHDVLYCKFCLSRLLSTNHNQCPINSKHQNTSYNQARNIRKQIYNLYVYCMHNQTHNDERKEGNSSCRWSGKLLKLSAHLNTCQHKKIHCNICNKLCTEHSIEEHNNIHIIKHISILSKSINSSIHSPSKLSSEALTNLKEQIKMLQTENVKLKKQIKFLKNDVNEIKISFSVNDTKTHLNCEKQYDKLQKLIKKQSNAVEAQNKRMNVLMKQNEELQSRMDLLPHEQSPFALSILNEKEENKDVPPMTRSNSTVHFHPEGAELYHPKTIKYEVYHPKKAVQVWVTKNIGNLIKMYRYSCCGSAKVGSVYLLKTKNNNKKDKKILYVAIEAKNKDNKLPNNWHNEMHLGCKKNKKKNKENTSAYLCCNGNILSTGCQKRYACCHKDVNSKISGCKVGWGC